MIFLLLPKILLQQLLKLLNHQTIVISEKRIILRIQNLEVAAVGYHYFFYKHYATLYRPRFRPENLYDLYLDYTRIYMFCWNKY